jgi:Predicted EndoIII-related endonuclease
VPKPQLPVIDEVVATVLSQHTSDVNSERAFARLKERFPTWEQVADAPVDEVAEAIRCGGIADQKARRIQQILAAIEEREGRIDLGRLDDLDDAAAEAYLLSLPGVGPKTAACVLVFSMGGPRSPSTPTSIASPPDWGGSRRTRRGQGAPAPRATGTARHPVRPAPRDDHPRAHDLPGAAAALRRMHSARPVRVRFGRRERARLGPAERIPDAWEHDG